MRIYSLQAPDGNIYDLQAPEGASEQELTATLYSLKPEAAQPFVKESGVIAQGKKGIEQLVSGFQTTGEVALGDKNEAARNALARQAEFDRKYEQSPSLDRTAEAFKQKGFFSGLGQLASDAPEVLSANLPQIGASYAGGKAGVATGSKLGSVFGPRGRAVGAFLGGAAGTLGVNYPSQLSGNVETQAEEQVSKGKPIDINVPAAAVTAIPQAAAEAVANSIFLGRGVLGKMLGLPESFLMKGGAASVEKLAQESLAATVAKGTATGFAAEFPAEIFQQVLQRYQAGQPLTSPEAYKQYAEIAYQTALLSPLGTAGRSLDKRGAKAQVQQKAYEEQQIADAEAQKAAQEVAPPQPQDIAGRYQAAEKRKAELKAQIRKVEEGSVTETADRLYNKELEEQIKAMAPELEQLATEYNQFQKTAPAPEAAAPEVTEVTPEDSKPARALTVGDSLDNPLGRFTKEELTSRSPKIAAYVDAQRKKMGKPSLNDYSIEDIRDAMPGQLPEAEKADLNSLIAAKTGHTGEVIYKPQDVVNIAKQKNINTDTVGFKYFLQRATGDNDLSNMSQPQLHSAFKSLSELPKYEETQNLPEKSSATHYSPEQYQKAVDRIKSLTTDGILPSAKAQEVAKQASGLKRDSDVQYMLQSAYRNGDLDLDSQGNFIRVNPAPQSEFKVEEGFEPAEPTGFNVMRGDKVLFSTQNEAEANAKAKTLGDSAAPTIKQVEKSIANEQKALSASQRSLDAMEVNGLFGTPEYNKASAKHTALVEESAKKVGNLNNTKEYLQQEVTVKTGKKAANVKAFTTKEKGVSEKSFASREEALKHAIENHTVARLNEIAAETKSPGLKARISKELERRKNPKPFLAAEKPVQEPVQQTAKKPAEEPLVTAQKESIKSQLLPMLKKFGLGDVALQIEAGMKEEGSYGASLVKVALDANNPIRVLRHESIHGLKDLGFFAPGQWKVLENQADKIWIDKYLKERNIDGRPLEAGQQSRYDAYYRLYKGDAQAIREEAIADAFGDFDVNGAPKGVFTTLLNNMRKFFEALRNSFNGAGYMTSDDVFGKIERGELSAGNKSTASPEVQAKFSLKPNPEVEKVVAAKINLTPQESAATSLGLQTGKPKQKQFSNKKIGGLPEVVQFLQDRRTASGLRPLDINKKEDRTTLAKLLTSEAVSAIYSGGNALSWYNETIARMMSMAALKFPELSTDRNAQMAFKLSTAITSQGLNVEDNLAFSINQYQSYAYNKRVGGIGQFDEVGQGADQTAMISNFKLANRMLKEYGEDTTRKFLETEFLAEELRAAGFKITGELGDEKITGSSIFGPKIGFGFYSNLNGNFEPVTMDMWFMRLVGRLTGSLRKFDPELFKTQLSRFRNAFEEEGNNGIYSNDFSQETLEKAKTDEASAIEFARVVNSVFNIDFKNNRLLYDDKLFKKTELVYSAQQMLGAVDSPKDAPSNGTERRQLRDVVRQTVDMVSEIQGQRIPPAALQALIWYPEQELYSTLGVKLRVTSQDYAGAIKKILLKDGYSEQSISAASKSGARQLQRMASQPVGQTVGQLGQKPQAAFTAEERSEFLEQARTKTVIEQERKEPKRKKVVFEVAPDPNNKALTESWNNLDQNTRLKISEGIARKIVRKVLAEFNLEGSFTSQVGSFLEETNPSFALFLESGDAVEVAKFIGFALSQKEMVVISPKETKGTEKLGAITLDVKTQDTKKIDDIYQQLRNIRVNGKQPIGGQSTMNGKMILLNYSDVATEDLARLIDYQLNGDYNVLTGDVYAAFPEKESYNYASPSNDPRGKGGDLRQRSRDLRNEATQQLRDELFKIRQQEELATGKRENIAISPAAKAAGNLKNVVTDKTLFEAQTELNQYDENLVNEQVTDAQRIKAEKALAPYMRLAEQEKPAFDAVVERITNDVGIQARPDPVKNIVRAAEKLVLETENGTKKPDASLILDLLRSTIVVDTEAEIQNAVREIEKSFDVVRVKDRFKNPAVTGYRDVLVNVKLPSGLIAEIQVNIPAMIGSKSTGHKLYRMSRNMEQGSPARMYLESLSNRLYDEAYRFSQNDISAASARDALLRKTSEGKALSGSAAKTSEPSSSSRTGVASTAQTLAPSGTSNITSPTKNGSITKASLRTAPDTPEFKRFFGDSRVVNADGTPKVLYHGSARDIGSFKRKTDRGVPIFLTDDPTFAEKFSKDSMAWMTAHPNQFLTETQIKEGRARAIVAIRKDFKQDTQGKEMIDSLKSGTYGDATAEAQEYLRKAYKDMMPSGPNIVAAYVKAENPFDYQNPEHVKDVLDEMNKSSDSQGMPEGRYFGGIKSGNWEQIETKRVQDAIKKLGFDSFYVEEGGRKNLAVYDSSQIKSATGNVGAYGQRPVTKEEAARSGMTQEEAQQAQAEGDIRYSLRTSFATPEAAERAASKKEAPKTEAFKQFFAGSQVEKDGRPQVMYHASPNEFSIFSDRKPIFVSPDAEDAQFFSATKRLGKGAKRDYIYPLWVRAQTPFDYENPNHVQMVVAKLAENFTDPAKGDRIQLATSVDSADKITKSLEDGRWTYIEDGRIQDAIKELGFDSFYVSEGNTKNLAVFSPNQVKSVTGNEGAFDLEQKDIRYSLREFRKDDLPKDKKTYTIPANTTLFHGSHKTQAEQIETAGRVLRSRSDVKASGGYTNEGGLIFFGDSKTAEDWAKNRGDPMSVRFDQEAGVIRDTGTVFQTITDKPYRLIKRRYELSASEAAKVTEALGLPEYKSLSAGDTASLAADRGDNFSNSKAPRYEVTKAGRKQTMSAPWPIIFDALGVDGYFDDFGIAISAKNGIRLEGNDGKMERYSLRTNVTEDIKNMPNGAAIFAAINRTTQTRQETGFVERIQNALAPESFSYLKQKGLNRYNRLNDVERLIAQKMGGVERLADLNAHSAALQSDLAAGVTASALGVGDRIGGMPVYKNGYTTVSNEGGTVKGAVAIFAPLARHGDPKIYQAYQFWAASKRGKRLLASGKEELFTPQDFAYAKQLEQQYPEFVSVQKDWIKYNDGLVKYAVDTGVISAQNAAEFVKYSDYLPFYRQIEGERTIGPNIFQSISGVKAPKKITGSEAPLADFLETIVRNTQATIQAGMKNVAAKKAADAGVMIGMVQKLDHVSSSPNTITILEKGQKVSYECADRLWVDAVSSLNLPELPFLSIFAKPADILRNLVTKDPGFMLANLMRDSVSAYVTSGAKITPLVSTMKEFGSVLMNSSPEYQKLLSAGVLGGYEFSRDIEASTSEFAKDIRKKTGTKTAFETATSPFTFFWNGLEKGTTASDAATRIAIYKATLKETGNEAEALHRSLEVLNFNRKGSSAVVRIAAAIIPFLNARVQGLDVFFRSGIRPFFDKDATAMEKQVQKAMFIRGATIMAMSTMYAAAIAGNPDYENQEEEVKDNNWIIPLGEGRPPLKIPTPFEVGTLFKTVPERIYRSFYGMDTNKDSAEAAKRALSNTFGLNPIPQIAAPLIEAQYNYSMFTHREIVSGNMKDIAPEYQVGANTSKVAQEIGMATGMSPIKLEYVYKGYTGTMGMYALDVLDASITSLMPNSGVQRASKRFEQMPVIKRFFADPEARGKITAYYDLKNSVDSVVRTINFLEKSNDPSIADYAQKNAMLYAAKDFINDLNKQMQDLQDQANMIRSADIPADQKRDILLEITKAQNLLVNDIRAIRKVIQP